MRISYGKLRVPVHRISGDDVFACEVSVEVLGDNFEPAYTEGDNSNVVATDTMKNFILREAAAYPGTTLEGFLAHIGRADDRHLPRDGGAARQRPRAALRPRGRQGVLALGRRLRGGAASRSAPAASARCAAAATG